jgi:hypothetical protein
LLKLYSMQGVASSSYLFCSSYICFSISLPCAKPRRAAHAGAAARFKPPFYTAIQEIKTRILGEVYAGMVRLCSLWRVDWVRSLGSCAKGATVL